MTSKSELVRHCLWAEHGDIFYDNTDRERFLNTVEELSERFAVDIFAYVLMDNHYHLLLKTGRANLSKAMQWFGTTYTRRFKAIKML